VKEHDAERRKVLVAYEDGDEEHMTVSQLKHFLLPDVPQQSSADRRRAPAAAAPQPRPATLRKFAAPVAVEVLAAASSEPAAQDQAPGTTPTAAQAAATIASWAPGESRAVADAAESDLQRPLQPSDDADVSLEQPGPVAASAGKPSVQAPPGQQQTAHKGSQQQQPEARPLPVPQLPPAGSVHTSDGVSVGAAEQPRKAAGAPAAEGINGGPAGVHSSQRDQAPATAHGKGTASGWPHCVDCDLSCQSAFVPMGFVRVTA